MDSANAFRMTLFGLPLEVLGARPSAGPQEAKLCKQGPASWERQKFAPEPQRDLSETSHPLPPPNVKASRRVTLEKTVANAEVPGLPGSGKGY